MKKLIGTLLICFTVSVAFLYADTGANKAYNLNDCLNIALEKHPQLKLAQGKITVSNSDLKNAYGKYYPSADAQMTYSHSFPSEKVVGMSNDAFNMNVGVNYPIFNGFSNEANYDRAESTLDANKLNLKYTLEQLKIDVYKLYTDVIRKQQIVKIRKENLELGQKELERIKAQYTAGTTHIGEVYAQEADLANTEFDLVTSENDENIAKTNLLIGIGMFPDMNAQFLESSLPKEADSLEISKFRNNIGNLNDLTSAAFKTRYDYLALKKSHEASVAQEKFAKASYYPTLSANAGWNWTNSQFNEFSKQGVPSVGLSLSIPIYHK